MSGRVIIGLNGYAQVGKDTIGSYLVERHGFTRVSLADKVRDALYALNPIVELDGDINTRYIRIRTLVDEVGWEEAKKYPDVRQLLQRMGTDVGRNFFGKDCWINLIREEARQYNKVVITDIRFDNEAVFVRDAEADKTLVARILREGYAPINSHISDQEIPTELTDTEFYNNIPIEELPAAIDRFVALHNI